jgi:hypothetical protein
MSLPPDSNRMQPDHLPTPFSAEDIRSGCQLGRTIRLRSEEPGGDPTFRRIRFVEVDADGAVQEFQVTDAEGRPLDEPTRHRSSWFELQQHASKPASETVIDEVELTLPLGTEACWRYTVGDGDHNVAFWFAKGRPGMPIQVEQYAGGELVSRSTVIADGAPSRGPA